MVSVCFTCVTAARVIEGDVIDSEIIDPTEMPYICTFGIKFSSGSFL